MSMVLNSLAATANMRSSCGHDVTSVFWKTARGLDVYCSRSALASGRSARSAMRTLQPRERRRDAKLKLMPANL